MSDEPNMEPEQLTQEDAESECGKPCDPAHSCEECLAYWERMRREGYWTDAKGWTDKGMKEMCK